MSLYQLDYQAKLGTTEIGVADVSIDYELNQVTGFQLVVANTSDNRGCISANIGETVHLFYEGIEVLTGRLDVRQIRYTRTRIELNCYASIINLNFEYFSKDQGQYDTKRVQYDNIAANSILADVLLGTGYTVSECPSSLISLRGEYETRLQWIGAIAAACKYDNAGETKSCDWYVDSSNGIHVVQNRGSAKGFFDEIEVESNDVDYQAIQNKVYGLGYGDGINQVQAEGGNSASQSTYGIREHKFVDRRFMSESSLQEEAQEKADTGSKPVSSIPCKMPTHVWFTNGFEVGDTIEFEDEEMTISSGTYRIIQASVGITTTTLTVSNVSPEMISQIQAAQKQIRVDGSYMQGQTVPLNFSNMDNVADGFPLELNVHIPNKTKAINAFYLSFDLARFRGWTTATEAESAHTHEFKVRFYHWDENTDGNIYLMGAFDDLSIPAMKIGTSGNDSPLKQETSEVGSSHSHDIGYGITEDADNSPSISITIDGVDRTTALGGPWTSDQFELDLTQYIQTTGKHTIELLSTARARIHADAWGQVFIQSD